MQKYFDQPSHSKQPLMQSNQPYPKTLPSHLPNEMGDHNFSNLPPSSAFGTALPTNEKPSMPFHGVEFQSSAFCPKNFIVFDQTDTRSQVMFNPAIANKLNFNYPGLNVHSAYPQRHTQGNFVTNEEIKIESSFLSKEDSDDIDALLSFEEEEEEDEENECDDEEVSTGRTNGNQGNRSPDSSFNHGSKPSKLRLSASIHKTSSSGNSCSNERKRIKLKRMVRMLRGMVPGGNQMDTVDILDEAVKYLKSLKVEVQKMGVDDSNN